MSRDYDGQIGQLIAALAKAQAKFEAPKKNKVARVKSEKGSYEYRYSDLADLIAAVRGPLAENELAFTHRLIPSERGTTVCTILAHSSGEMLTSEYIVPHFQRQQEFGSALTYAKRYALSSLLGVAADDDDDGNIADADAVGRPQTRVPANGATRTATALPPPERPAGVNGAALPAHPEENGETTAARQRVRMLIDRLDHGIKGAKNSVALDALWTSAQAEDDLAEITAAGGDGAAAASTLRSKYARAREKLVSAEALA